jgi:hypothetical protein
MAGIGWAPLGGEWWTWQWCLSASLLDRQLSGHGQFVLPTRVSQNVSGRPVRRPHCWGAAAAQQPGTKTPRLGFSWVYTGQHGSEHARKARTAHRARCGAVARKS